MSSAPVNLASCIAALLLQLTCSADLQGARHTLALEGNDWLLSGGTLKAPLPFSVPGDVNDALVQAGHLDIDGDLYFNENQIAARPIGYSEWWINKTLVVPAAWADLRTQHLLLDGVDFNVTIFINGQRLGKHMGQYHQATFDVVKHLWPGASNELAIVFHSPPKHVLDCWTHDCSTMVNGLLPWWKSSIGLGSTANDFSQGLWTIGLANASFAAASGGYWLSQFGVLSTLMPPYKDATINLSADIAAEVDGLVEVHYAVECTTTNAPFASGSQVVNLTAGRHTATFSLALDSPALWWPRGHGPQNLYRASLSLVAGGHVLDEVVRPFGIREVLHVENPGPDSWTYIEPYKSAACGPLVPGQSSQMNCSYPFLGTTPEELQANRSWTLQINGRRVFARGANWNACDLMQTRCTWHDYHYLLRMAAGANFNFLRIFGGASIEGEVFYDLADQLGLMVYQELMHPENWDMPESDEQFANEAIEIEEMARRLQNHPSLVRYGWGNEYYGVNRTTSRFVRLYHDLLARIDPTRRATTGSPITWVQRHGPYCFYFMDSEPHSDEQFPCSRGRKTYAVYNDLDKKIMNQEGPNNPFEFDEYGAAGIASEYTLRKIIPANELFPVNETSRSWQYHRAFGACNSNTWLGRDAYVALFGEPTDLQHEIYASQFAQSEGLRYANQAHRRLQPHRSLSSFWMFNEPWPVAAYGSIVEHYGPAKMAYYAATQSAYAETDVSLRYEGLVFPANGILDASVWYATDTLTSFDSNLSAVLFSLTGDVLQQHEWSVRIQGGMGPGVSDNVGNLDFALPSTAMPLLVRLRLESAGRKVSEQVYAFAGAEKGKTVDAPLAGLFTAPAVGLSLLAHAYRKKHRATLTNVHTAPALYVELKLLVPGVPEANQFHPAIFEDNFMFVWPGETVQISFEVLAPVEGLHLCARAWNSLQVCASLSAGEVSFV